MAFVAIEFAISFLNRGARDEPDTGDHVSGTATATSTFE